MNKERLEKELRKVLDDANALQEKSELELKTSEFLKSQADDLLKKFEHPTTTIEEKLQIEKQMGAMFTRIAYEITQFEKDVVRMKILESKLEDLRLETESYLEKE